jgi:hypothetical protein
MNAPVGYRHKTDGDPDPLGEFCTDCSEFGPRLVDWVGADRFSRPNLLDSDGSTPAIPAIIAALAPALLAVAPAYSALWRRLDAHWRRPGARLGRDWAPVPDVADALRTTRALVSSLYREILVAIDDALAAAEAGEHALAVLDFGVGVFDAQGNLVPTGKAAHRPGAPASDACPSQQ